MKNSTQFRTTLTAFAATTALALSASAAPLVYEPFIPASGGSGDTFVGNTTGSINLGQWNNGSSGTTAQKTFKAYGESYAFSAPYNDGTNQLAASGLSAYLDGNQRDIVAALNTPLVFGDGEVMYASFMISKLGDFQTDEIRFDFDSNQLDILANTGSAGSDGVWSLRARDNSGTTTAAALEDAFAIGEAVFVAVKIQFSATTNEIIQLAVAPGLDAEPAWALTREAELGTTLSSLQMHCPGANTSPAPGADLNLDEIRIGTNYTDVVPVDTSLLPPFTLNATGGDALVDLSWAPAASAASYTIYRSTVSGSGYASVVSGLTTNGYQDPGVVNNTTYYYVVTSVNGGESVNSPEASATPVSSGDTTPPAVPTSLSATAANHYTIALSWDQNLTDPDFAFYTVYRSDTSGTNYAEMASGLTTNVYTDATVLEEQTYYYTVSATDLIGNESNPSTEAMETVPLNWRTGDINWGTLPSQGGYVDLNNDGPLQIGNNKTWVFQIADSVDSNTLYDVAVKLSGVSASPKETGSGLGIGNNHIYSNETFSISLEGVYVRGTTGLADKGLDTGTQAISGEAVEVTGSTLSLVDWAQETAGTLTNEVFGGTNFVWYGIQGGNQGGLDWSHFRVVGGTVLSGFDVWAAKWGPIGSETDDYDNDGVLNLAEYGLNGDPTNGVDDTEIELLDNGGLKYIHAKRKGDLSLVYTVQTIDDLVYGSWTNEGYTSIVGIYEPSEPEAEYDYVTNAVPTTDPQKFIRVKIEN